MDENKLKKLQEIGYQIKNVCAMCQHSEFSNQTTLWGVCLIQNYNHLKHTDSTRQLSICKYGSCGKFKKSEKVDFSKFNCFMVEDER